MSQASLCRSSWQIVSAFMLLCSLANADTVTSVSCSTPTAPFATGASNCDALGSYGYSQATAGFSEVMPTTASQAAVINARSTASALQFGAHGVAGTATAQSSVDLGIIFDTTGAVRSGLLELSFLQNTWVTPVNGLMKESLTVGSYSISPEGSSLSTIWIPIELGSQFGFEYLQSIAAIGSSIKRPPAAGRSIRKSHCKPLKPTGRPACSYLTLPGTRQSCWRLQSLEPSGWCCLVLH